MCDGRTIGRSRVQLFRTLGAIDESIASNHGCRLANATLGLSSQQMPALRQRVESLTPPKEGAEASPEASPAETPEPPAIAPGTVITKQTDAVPAVLQRRRDRLCRVNGSGRCPMTYGSRSARPKIIRSAPFIEASEKVWRTDRLAKDLMGGGCQKLCCWDSVPDTTRTQPGNKILTNVNYRFSRI